MMRKVFYPTIAILCIGCHNLVPDDSSVELNIQDFEAAWTHIDLTYPLLDYKGIDWDEVYVDYRTRAEQTVGDDIYQVLYDMVGRLEDGHASVLTLGGTKVRPYTPSRMIRDANALDVNLIRKYFDKPLIVIANEAIEYQFITESIGYVRLSTFGSRLSGRQDEFAECVRYFQEADGLIIDVRENDGGGSSVYDPIVGYLISDTVFSGYQVKVNEVIEPGLIPPNQSLTFTKSIIILINGTTFSAGEVFADRFWQQSHVTLLGDTTAGGGMSSNTNPVFTLPSGKAISLNTSAVFRGDSIPIEWNGVPPDIYVRQTAADAVAGVDHQLEAAITRLSQ